MRILVRTQPRPDDYTTKAKVERFDGSLRNLDRVRKVEELGKEAGFKDKETSSKYADASAERTGTTVRKPFGIAVVYPKDLPDDEFWKQLESLPLRRPRGKSKPARKSPGSKKPKKREFNTDFD